jgi:hypothetical protein
MIEIILKDCELIPKIRNLDWIVGNTELHCGANKGSITTSSLNRKNGDCCKTPLILSGK